MLISPAVLGLVVGVEGWLSSEEPSWVTLVVLAAVVSAWFFGYFSFFAFGLVVRARNPQRRARYRLPVFVYGGVAILLLATALLLEPALVSWAVLYCPLIVVAIEETFRGRSRSVVSGVSTTLASALLLPVLATVGNLGTGVATWVTPDLVCPGVWAMSAFLAVYFTGTIPFVKTMIREKGNQNYYIGSMIYHVMGLITVVVLAAAVDLNWFGAGLVTVTMLVALGRAVVIPVLDKRHGGWNARRVGMTEIPVLLLACTAVLFSLLG